MRRSRGVLGADEEVEVTVALELFGERVTEDQTVPAAPVRPRRLLPVVQSLMETVLQHSVARAPGAVSCRAGCAACCSHLVPIAAAEAHVLRDLVEELPEPRRSAIRTRFAESVGRVTRAGLLPRLTRDLDSLEPEAHGRLALAYFGLGIPCVFLEEGQCAIYADRPLACREHLVTSPPEACSRADREGVVPVELPGSLSRAFGRLSPPGSPSRGRMPLILALSHAERHPDSGPLRPGAALLGELMTAEAPPRPRGAKSRK